MKNTLLILMMLFACITVANSQNNTPPETAGGWKKYEFNPILGGHIGTIADLCIVPKEEGGYRMYCSWREAHCIGMSESKDGITWTIPKVCLPFNLKSGWEEDVNRPVVLKKDGLYHMWYTGQIGAATHEGRSFIGYATSTDGVNWKRMSGKPTLQSELPWEKHATMCPHVIWDEQEKLFKIWYSAGENWEPDGIGYATSKDGLHWEKYKGNPVFDKNKANEWEKNKVTGCQVIKRDNDYLMLYIGFGPGSAQIGMARSKNGVTGWERYADNPIIRKGPLYDNTAVFKPYAVPDPANNRWLLYYNGCNNWHEQTFVVFHEGMDLGF